MTDFNFFILNKKTGRGLYQHYHHSQATTVFCKLLKDYYNELRAKLLNEESEKLITTKGFSEKKAIQKAKDKYFHSLFAVVLERPGEIGELIKELKQLNTLSFEPYSYENYTRFARSTSHFLKKVKQKIYFDKRYSALPECKSWAAKIVNKDVMKNAVCEGIDINGREAIIKLNKDYQVLHTYNYNDVVVQISLDDLTESLTTSLVVDELMALSQKRSIKALLETPEHD